MNFDTLHNAIGNAFSHAKTEKDYNQLAVILLTAVNATDNTLDRLKRSRITGGTD